MQTRRTCGAKTRAGHPCKSKNLFANGRCKNHGGMSSGPKTDKGRAKALANLKQFKGPIEAADDGKIAARGLTLADRLRQV